MDISWTCKSFSELSTTELYEILRLRQSVFIVEQNCPYLDCDRKDFDSLHLMGWSDNHELLAYARIVAPEISYTEVSIGRVITSLAYRKYGFGKLLIAEAIRTIEKHYGNAPIRIGAQSYLLNFYTSFGFQTLEPYIEDGIPHHIMLRPAKDC